jgi:predicted nucleotidyltransferase
MNTINNKNILFYQNEIIGFLKSRLDLVAVYLYGSILTSQFNDQSDIDISVISEKEIDPLALYEISAGLSVLLKRDIHLIDFIKANEVLKIEILKNKTILFEKDEEKRLYHEMNALTAYQKLNEEREIVMKTKYGEAAWRSL